MSEDATALSSLPVKALVASGDNPRADLGDVSELRDSIAALGVIEPLVVAPALRGMYTVVSGHRRLRAAKQAGLRHVPVRVTGLEGAMRVAAQLAANVQREALGPVDEARGYQRLIAEHGLTQRQAARMVGKSQGHVSKRLALLDLDEDVLGDVAERRIPLKSVDTRTKRAFVSRAAPLPERVPLSASAVLGRLTSRAAGEGIWLTPRECDFIADLVIRAAAALRDKEAA